MLPRSSGHPPAPRHCGARCSTAGRSACCTRRCRRVGNSELATLVGTPLGFVLARIALPSRGAADRPRRPGGPAALRGRIGVDRRCRRHRLHCRRSDCRTDGCLLPTHDARDRSRRPARRPATRGCGAAGATPARVLRRITWPLVLPTVTSAALVIFVLAISEFSVPGLLRVRVFTTEVFTAFAALYDFGLATVLSLPLLMVSIVSPPAPRFAGSPAGHNQAQRWWCRRRAFDEWRPAAAVAVVVVIAAMLIVPVTVLVREAADRPVSALIWNSRRAVSTAWPRHGWRDRRRRCWAACLGYARARATATAGSALDAFWVVLCRARAR